MPEFEAGGGPWHLFPTSDNHALFVDFTLDLPVAPLGQHWQVLSFRATGYAHPDGFHNVAGSVLAIESGVTIKNRHIASVQTISRLGDPYPGPTPFEAVGACTFPDVLCTETMIGVLTFSGTGFFDIRFPWDVVVEHFYVTCQLIDGICVGLPPVRYNCTGCACVPTNDPTATYATLSECLKNCCTGGGPTIGRGRNVSYDVSDARRHLRTYIGGETAYNTPGPLFAGVASDVLPITFSDYTTPLVLNDACVRYDRQSAESLAYLLAEKAGVLSLYSTADEGISWSMPTTIMSARHPALLIGRDGRRFCYGVVPKGGGFAVHGKIYDSVGNLLVNEFEAIPACDDDSIACDESVTQAQVWFVGIVYRLGGNIMYASAIDGAAFT